MHDVLAIYTPCLPRPNVLAATGYDQTPRPVDAGHCACNYAIEHDPFPQPPTSISRGLEEDEGSQNNPQLQWKRAFENRSNQWFYVMFYVVRTGVSSLLPCPFNQPRTQKCARQRDVAPALLITHRGNTFFLKYSRQGQPGLGANNVEIARRRFRHGVGQLSPESRGEPAKSHDRLKYISHCRRGNTQRTNTSFLLRPCPMEVNTDIISLDFRFATPPFTHPLPLNNDLKMNPRLLRPGLSTPRRPDARS